ncbi:hypothetical protein A4R63_07330 [Corynebacterium pseudotuberculosis]|nr:Hypothetical protein CpE19_1453 [Corynebacterium pseudotuberculosis]APB11306.1 hypothetical protein A4R72_07560 [Corynebacterium pseudotuberculosis]APB13350.1 hypothetical protein A4R71_07575 [Corynebacterium pseudotuberculosis]APB15394.1 hypothetical protein A4R68_07570 [Corynebacterium pseudotuberculosis]APB17439.1 hypothetical protein A4R67_07545 [Corynebacterium pseudotuberculosis]
MLVQIEQVAKELQELIVYNARVIQDQQVYGKTFNATHQKHQVLLAEHAVVVAEIQNKHNWISAYRYFQQETAKLGVDQLVFSPYL